MQQTQKKRLKNVTLYFSIVVLVTLVIIVALLANYGLVTTQMSSIVNLRLGVNAIRISDTVAASPKVIKALTANPPDEIKILEVISNVSNATNASIVVFGADKKLLSIYNPTSESLFQKDIKPYGQLDLLNGLPADLFKRNNVKTIYDDDKKVIGYLIVGFPEDMVALLNKDIVNWLLIASLLGLTVGIMGALYLSKRIKKILFGYEPAEIAYLLQERNTLLDTVNEGVIAVDAVQNVLLINKEGQRILTKANTQGIETLIDKSFANIAETKELTAVLQTGKPISHLNMEVGDLWLFADIQPILLKDKVTGALITLTEQNTVKEMAEQVSGVTNYADALRAQMHEFMNKMHVIAGLVTTKNYDELGKYVRQIFDSDDINISYITQRIKEPLLSSFLIGKKSRANELNIRFSLSDESNFPVFSDKSIPVHDIILIVGNLLENSFDAVRFQKNERLVNLTLLTYEDELFIIVENNGPAIPEDKLKEIFKKGFTTKGEGHGIGLSLVMNTLNTLNAKIFVESDAVNGTIFTVNIPIK